MTPKAKPIKPPDPDRQARFHEQLVLARKTWLMDALSDTLSRIDPNTLKSELTTYAPADVQQILAASGIRDEHVFPTPVILEAQPTLVGYYRLLLGVPQKTFYGRGTGMGRFRLMEEEGRVTSATRAALPAFCAAMASALADLVRRISPVITPRDIAELPLLTLGQFFQGGNNNAIGQAAINAVFLAIADIVNGLIKNRTGSELRVGTPQGRRFVIALAGDPDVRVQEIDANDDLHNLLAIEIKGGTDKSNVYNRGGEAEKSHRSAKAGGYQECWTVIGMAEIDLPKLKGGSPTTDFWFDTPQVVAQQGLDWDAFRGRLRRHLGM
jgi:hypothetical protein